MISRKILLEAVTVCVNYSDFLEEVIPYNLPQVDLWTVVTTPEDRATQALCSKHGIRVVKTDCFYRDVEKPRINKCRGINYGLAHHSLNGWVLHLDGDVVLPPQFRRMLENCDLDESCIYGMDRIDIIGSDAWDKLRAGPMLQYDWSCLVYPPQGRLGARIAHGDYGGYCPIGFFQLWHPGTSGVKRYPVKVDSDMEHTDVLHAIQWPRQKRVLLPEGFCVHLASSEKFGNNWQGRKSPPFRAPKGDQKTNPPRPPGS